LTRGKVAFIRAGMKTRKTLTRRSSAAHGSEAPSRERKIVELELEIKRLRRLGRTKREPVAGIGGTIQRIREQGAMQNTTTTTNAARDAGQVTVSYPYGFSEQVPTVADAEKKLRESSHTGEIEADPKDAGRYQEYRDFGPDGPGWYFAGRVFLP
jgi:hypothetical protein